MNNNNKQFSQAVVKREVQIISLFTLWRRVIIAWR